MADDTPICLPLPRECCSFVDQNEAYDVQFIEDGRVVCITYGKDAFSVNWIYIDSFYGTKKFVITALNKIDDTIMLLSLDSYLLSTFDGDYSVQFVQMRKNEECVTRNLVSKTEGYVKKLARHGDLILVVLSVFEERYEEMHKSMDFRVYRIGEWDAPMKVVRLEDEHFLHMDFVGCAENGNICFFSGRGRLFHVDDFERVVEVDVEKSKASTSPTLGLREIFAHNIEHLAKNASGAWYKDHFYLYTAPNPAVVQLEHYFLCLSLETKQWRKIVIDSPRFTGTLEVHITINSEGVLVMDRRDVWEERNIHRIPLSEPARLLHLAQFATNRAHGNFVEMSEEERRAHGFPFRLALDPAFYPEEMSMYTISKKFERVVVSDAPYGQGT